MAFQENSERTPMSRLRPSRPPPPPSADEPSDDELLRYLDGAMAPGERIVFEARLEASPLATTRIEVLASALLENGWPVDDEPGRA